MEPKICENRRFHAYCVGIAKSGTRSMAWIFMKNYKAEHEPDADDFIDRIMGLGKYMGTHNDSLFEYLMKRDLRLCLELESAHPLYYVIEVLVKLFPEAMYILTIRDCYTWLDSIINQHYSMMVKPNPHSNPFFKLLNDQYIRQDISYSYEEQKLMQYNIPPIENYLSFWKKHNEKMLRTIPSDKLLIIRTHEISEQFDRIADFLRIPVHTLDYTKAHAHKRDVKPINLLSLMSWTFIEERVNIHCRELMEKYFSDIRNLDDLKNIHQIFLHSSINPEWLSY